MAIDFSFSYKQSHMHQSGPWQVTLQSEGFIKGLLTKARVERVTSRDSNFLGMYSGGDSAPTLGLKGRRDRATWRGLSERSCGLQSEDTTPRGKPSRKGEKGINTSGSRSSLPLISNRGLLWQNLTERQMQGSHSDLCLLDTEESGEGWRIYLQG